MKSKTVKVEAFDKTYNLRLEKPRSKIFYDWDHEVFYRNKSIGYVRQERDYPGAWESYNHRMEEQSGGLQGHCGMDGYQDKSGKIQALEDVLEMHLERG